MVEYEGYVLVPYEGAKYTIKGINDRVFTKISYAKMWINYININLQKEIDACLE